ncbi:MAG: hypothetical protein WCA22_16270 [Candidatus Binatus sp.]
MAARIAIELMRSNETGCNLNHKWLTLIEIERPPPRDTNLALNPADLRTSIIARRPGDEEALHL